MGEVELHLCMGELGLIAVARVSALEGLGQIAGPWASVGS